MGEIIFVNGTFDVLHLGHLSLLSYAKMQGDLLVVAIDSDRRVKEKKGPTRPINNQDERKAMLDALKAVDCVQVFDSDDELRNLVKIFHPTIMIVGDDYRGKEVIGSEFAEKLIFYKKIDGYSTTKKIQDIIGR